MKPYPSTSIFLDIGLKLKNFPEEMVFQTMKVKKETTFISSNSSRCFIGILKSFTRFVGKYLQ